MKLDLNIAAPDAFYAAVATSAEGLSDDESQAVMLRLVFLLANQIGDDEVLFDCLEAAVKTKRQKDT